MWTVVQIITMPVTTIYSAAIVTSVTVERTKLTSPRMMMMR
jgi:hypothetical protein